MNAGARLTKLERALDDDGRRCICPHAGLNVRYGPNGSDSQAEHRKPPAEMPNCEICGGYQILLMVVYDSTPTDAIK
jgi:hypothetical protein